MEKNSTSALNCFGTAVLESARTSVYAYGSALLVSRISSHKRVLRNAFIFVALIPSLAFAQAPSNSFNTKEPIEITSDTLEVQQKANEATFLGNVVAIQGQVRLKSDRMTVYYRSADEKKAAGAAVTQSQTIKKIDVTGNVFLSTPEETASGARGDYDVVGQEIHLYDNVVLTRGKNTLKGNQLTYNFASGHSVISGGTVATDGASKGKERVRALFVPEDKGKKP